MEIDRTKRDHYVELLEKMLGVKQMNYALLNDGSDSCKKCLKVSTALRELMRVTEEKISDDKKKWDKFKLEKVVDYFVKERSYIIADAEMLGVCSHLKETLCLHGEEKGEDYLRARAIFEDPLRRGF